MTRDKRNSAVISIVDDDKSVRDAVRALLESLGYSPATFASAEEFLQSGRLKETACLITDGMSGVDLQDHLIVSGERTPVIFVTAFPEETLHERALGAGAFGFLTKPFSEESLIACLDKALTLCEFCKEGRMTKRMEEMAFPPVTVLVSTCDNCGLKSLDPESDEIVDEAVSTRPLPPRPSSRPATKASRGS